MGLLALALIAVGVGADRRRRRPRPRPPYRRYMALKEQDANVARYEAWRGGAAIGLEDRRLGRDGDPAPPGCRSAARIIGAGVVCIVIGFIVR